MTPGGALFLVTTGEAQLVSLPTFFYEAWMGLGDLKSAANQLLTTVLAEL